MTSAARRNFIKGLILAVLVLLAAIIQNASGFSIEIGGARCFLILPVCVVLGIGENEFAASLIGLWGGLLWDTVSAVHTCYNAVFLCIVCFICSAFITEILRDTFITNMIFTFFVSVLYVLFYWLFFIIIKGVDGAEYSLFTFYLPSALYTFIVSALVWLIYRPIKKKFQFSEMSEMSTI